MLQVGCETGRVLAVEVVQQSQPMYNLSVDMAHTFFVGAGQWLVHNCIDAKKISIPGPTNSPFGKLDYLLGRVSGNADSIGKGGFFKDALGFSDESLESALTSHLIDNFQNAERYTRKVNTLSVTGAIKGANGKVAQVTSVWEAMADGTYRLITAHPAAK